MLDTVPIDNHEGLYRDISSGAVINIDNAGYNSYMRQKTIIRKAKDEAEMQREKIAELERQIIEITAAVKQILNKGQDGASTTPK